VIPVPVTAEEDADATDRARQAAGRAGSLEVMPSSQGSRVLPARMRFPIRRRYAGSPELRALPGERRHHVRGVARQEDAASAPLVGDQAVELVDDRALDLARDDLAVRLGTSRPRLSTYMSGKVTPSAALMLWMHRVAAQAQATPQ
jgi:hypothetical protein